MFRKAWARKARGAMDFAFGQRCADADPQKYATIYVEVRFRVRGEVCKRHASLLCLSVLATDS
eukprot:7639540-Lingulodinium_polyedra.AAC.1